VPAFRKLLGVLGSVVSVSACGSPEPRLREGLTGEDLCTLEGGTQFSYVEGLEPRAPTEYLEWRWTAPYSASQWAELKASVQDDDTLTPAEREQVLDDAFQSFVAASETSGTCVYPDCDRYVVPNDQEGFNAEYPLIEHLFAHGADGPTIVTNAAEAKAFLGDIDTPQEAAWLAYAEGYVVICDGTTYEKVDDGYLLYVERGDACTPYTGHRLHVSTSGTIEELDAEQVDEGNDCIE